MSNRSKKPDAPESTPAGEKETVIDGEVKPGDAVQKNPAQAETPMTVLHGRAIYVCGSKFSRPFMLQAAQDFQAGKVKGAAQIRLPDGQTITAGPNYETRMGPELMQLIKKGVLQASTFGKFAKNR